jgi:DNA topoisomerase-1
LADAKEIQIRVDFDAKTADKKGKIFRENNLVIIFTGFLTA